MKTKGFIVLLLVLGILLSGCSLFGGESSSQQPETVIVTETVYVTEPTASQPETSVEETTQEFTQAETTEAIQGTTQKKGYTTEDILKKAAEAADKQYWIVYYSKYDNNRVEMASFNALEGFQVTLREDKSVKCDKLVGEFSAFVFEDDKNNFIEHVDKQGFSTIGIIGSNCDIYDEKNDTTIKANAK